MENKVKNISDVCVEHILQDCRFRICHKIVEGKRDASYVENSKIGFSKRSLEFLEGKGISALWEHQATAIKESINGKNICITTSTSSGKTEIFQLSAIEVLQKNKNSKVLAVYPMKALNRQQLERWETTGYKIGKIDGDITNFQDRIKVLSDSNVVVITPDVMHAFLLGKINDPICGKIIKDFIKNVSLVIIDELHLYKGIFGTNSAYLFRRFNNLHRLLCKKNIFAQYITASATLPNAIEHSINITGAPDFIEIGIEQDKSPMAKKTFYFVEHKKSKKEEDKGGLKQLVHSLSNIEGSKSITFVEARQRTGEMAALNIDNKFLDNVEETGLYPYRAGYERETVDEITRNLHDGKFKGVISTSALEIGIDIKGLNIVVIADMPQDKNSYQQRIGRVGRFGCDSSYVIIVRDGSFSSELLFDKYNYDIDKVLPNYEPALYLEDKNVQNIHAFCHVGDNDSCEYLDWKGRVNMQRVFDGKGYFPDSFISLCQDILSGQTSRMYDDIKVDSPHHAYPIRFFGKQYKITAALDEQKHIPNETISREQICTEGYTGAIRNSMYNKCHIKERIVKINLINGEIYAKREYNRFIKTSSYHKRIVIPNFKEEYRNGNMLYDDTKVFNLRVKEHQTIYGYYEHLSHGNQIYNQYERPFSLPELSTTGTVIFHPSFNNSNVNISIIASVVYEAFLRRNAFDRNDINYYGGKLYSNYESLKIDDRFIAIYDISSLNISSRIINKDLVHDLFSFLNEHLEVISYSLFPTINEQTITAMSDLCNSIINSKPNVQYQDIGTEYIYVGGTEVLYLEENTETGEINERKAINIGLGTIPNTLNLMIDRTLHFNIPLDNIKSTCNTKYEPKQ